MLQSSLKPGLAFQRCNSAYVTRLPVIWRTVSSAERQYVPRTSTSTPSTSKIRICGRSVFFIVSRGAPGIVGFPSARRNARGSRRKIYESRISRWPREESSHGEGRQKAHRHSKESRKECTRPLNRHFER